MLADTKIEISAQQIDESSDMPLYQQIYSLLREKIVSGKVSANTRLPTEKELSDRLGVSRITVKRAMNELATSGLVRRHRGLGTVVTFDATAPTVKGSFDNLIDGLTRMGLDTEVSLLDCTIMSPEPEVAKALELKPRQKVQRIVRLRKLEGEPFSYLVTCIPADVAKGYSESELASESLIALLEKAGHAPREAEQTITATAADPAVASMLGIAPGSPLMRIHRIMRNGDGRPVQDITANYRADRFQYHMKLVRPSDAKWTETT